MALRLRTLTVLAADLFGSQLPRGSSQMPVTSVPGHLNACGTHQLTQAHTPTNEK